MKKLLFITNRKLIHSIYVPEQCLTMIKKLIVETLYGNYSILCGGVLYKIEYTRELGLYYNTFDPTVNIDISQTDNGSEIEIFFEINGTAKKFSKFVYSLLLIFELVFVASEVLTGTISNVLLLMLPLEMLMVWHIVVNMGFAITIKRYTKKFDATLQKNSTA